MTRFAVLMPQPSAVSPHLGPSDTFSVCSAVIGVDHQAWLCSGNAILAALP